MQSYGTRVFEQKDEAAQKVRGGAGRGQSGMRLRAVALAVLTLAAGVPTGYSQQTVTGAGSNRPDKAASDLPAAPVPVATQPYNLRPSKRDFSKPAAGLLGNPINVYRPTSIAKANFANSVRLADLVKDGKIYLSLSDALALALENNYDIAIARYNLDIADTDILRTKAGQAPLGVATGVVANTLNGAASTSASVSGGGPGGTSGGSGGASAGAGGITFSTSGAGPNPQSYLDPTITSLVELQRQEFPQTSLFSPRFSENTDQYNFTYNQGFVTGTGLQVGFNNSRITSSSPYNVYSPQLSASFQATVTQQLLQGAGIWVNKRFMYQAINDRRITDSSFREQILYTVNQVENIYWGLVQSYEDVQAKERQLEQSSKLLGDDRKQLEIGTVAPLQVTSDESSVASDKQALITSQLSLNYQQQIIKQAIARNLNDPALSAAPVIPTDRVTTEELPEEKQPVEALVQEAFQNSPLLEQRVLGLKNDEITLKGARNALLPNLNVQAFYGASAAGGAQSPDCLTLSSSGEFVPCTPGTVPSVGYGTVLSNLGNSSAPNKGVTFNLSIPLRNRVAQAQQARSLMEYRQAELGLEQLYTQIRMQVVNAQFALTTDRAQVDASVAARDYQQQSVDAELKKLHLGASTSANVLLQQRNLATAENNLIAAHAAYAKDRAALYQIHYGINLNDAAAGVVNTAPVIPGVEAAKPGKEATTTPPASK
ncbi:MAG: TolC family protein [Terracidiphilus sp.]